MLLAQLQLMAVCTVTAAVSVHLTPLVLSKRPWKFPLALLLRSNSGDPPVARFLLVLSWREDWHCGFIEY